MTELSYNHYVEILNDYQLLSESTNINEGLVDKIEGVKGKIGKILVLVKSELSTVLSEVKVPFETLISAFKDKDIYAILKHFGFSIIGMMKAIHLAANSVIKSYTSVFKALHQSKVFQKIKSGSMKVDEVLDKYPILKKLTGPMVAGILLWSWLNISFIGQFDYDFDVSAMLDSLKGDFSITDLFASPEGLTMMAFVATNIASGGLLSVAWLGSTKANFVMALVYTVMKKKGIDQQKIKEIVLKRKKLKTEALDESLFPDRKQTAELGKQIITLTRKLGKDRAQTLLDIAAKDIEDKNDARILSVMELPKGFNKTSKDETLFQFFKKYFLARKTFGFLNTYLIYDNLSALIKK